MKFKVSPKLLLIMVTSFLFISTIVKAENEPSINEVIPPTPDPVVAGDSSNNSTTDLPKIDEKDIAEPESPSVPLPIGPETINSKGVQPLTSDYNAIVVPPDLSNSNLAPSTIKQLIPEADQSTGALIYNYQINVPPGRNGLQPNLKLTYNSQSNEEASVLSNGWSINIPYIERINRKGTDKLYSEKYFFSSLSGELVPINTTSYKAKVDNGDFLIYSFSSSTWQVTDKFGNIYKLGNAFASRQDDPNDNTRVNKWMLAEQRDLNDNFVKYEYFKDSGQIYPSRIVYTGNGGTDGPLEITFLRESRQDVIPNFRANFGVSTTYRINEIDVKLNANLVKKYELSFTKGDNGFKSELASLKESGSDENQNFLSQVSTTFFYQTSTTGWGQNNDISQSPIVFDSGANCGKIIDVNGDGIQDMVQSNIYERYTYIGSGSGWTASSTWTMPTDPDNSNYPVYLCNASGVDEGARFADVNGDGLIDVLQFWQGSGSDLKGVYLNTGSGWTKNSTWNIPVPFYYFNGDNGVRIGDVNGDGLPDLVYSNRRNGVSVGKVYLNNGAGWSEDIAWSVPTFFSDYYGQDYGSVLMDINDDGLADILLSNGNTQSKAIYINNGHGWSSDPSWGQIPEYFINGSYKDNGVRFVDLNGDGLMDMIASRFSNYYASGCYYFDEWKASYANTGKAWETTTSSNQNIGCSPNPIDIYSVSNSSSIPFFISDTNGNDQGSRFMDIQGSNLSDNIVSKYLGSGQYLRAAYAKRGYRADLLSKIVFPFGGSTSIVYKSSPLYRADDASLSNPKTPFVLDTVHKIINNDGYGTSSVYTYQYNDGKYYYNDPYDRKFAGFGVVNKLDSVSTSQKTYYHQGDSSNTSLGEYNDNYAKIGKPYRVEVVDNLGSVYSKQVNKWDNFGVGSSSTFVGLIQQLDMSYDGNSLHKDKAQSYSYNTTSTGNLLQKIDWGEVNGSDDGSFVDTGSDAFTTNYSYAINTTSNILGLESQETVLDQNSNKVKEDRFYYDSLSLGGVSKGNETKHEYWKTGSTYINTQKVYNNFGLVTQEIDGRGKTTTSSYDIYNLYVTTSTNPLNQKRVFSYDYSNGKPKQIIDENSLITQTVFDGLDRVIATKKSDFSPTSTIVTTTAYTYNAQPIGTQIIQTDYLSATSSVTSYSYTDGYDRIIQKRKQSDDVNTFVVSDLTYGNRGLVERETLPYFASGSASSTPTTTAALYKIYAYDPLQRLAYVATSVGTTTNSYDRWKTVMTDENGNSKNLYKDAFGNLIRVEENNGGSVYVTTYAYNYLKNLTNITDANGNVRNFTYDGLGRKIGSEDLHAVGDTTFGTSTFVCDDNGNITQKVDPKSQVTNYNYDNLNRPLKEDYTGKSGTEILYGYDNCWLGMGKICTVTTTGSVVVKYAYDSFGNVKQTTSTINSINYLTKYNYDRQGNATTITYPDNSQVQYLYSNAGLPQSILIKENSDAGFRPLVTNITHSPLGQPVQIQYASGVTTTYSYDAGKLYRLVNKLTSLPTSSLGYYGEGFVPGVYALMSTTTSGVMGGPTEARNLNINGLWITQSITYDESFEGNMGYWKFWAGNGSSATQDCSSSYTGNCSEKITVPSSGNVWDVQFWQDLRVDNNVNYTVKFRAKSLATSSITFGINQDHSPWSDYGLAAGVSVTPNWKQYQYSFTSNGTDELARVFFYAGASTSTYWLDDVEVIPDGINMLKNQSFETGMNNWYVWSNGGSGQSTNSVDCTTGTDGACSNKTVVNYGGQHWQVQLAQNLGVSTSTAYILTFDAKGATSTTAAVAINQNHDAYSDLWFNNFSLGNTWKSYQYEVSPTQGDPNARLIFYLGASTNTIWLDNLRFSPKQASKITSTPQFSALYESANTSTYATNYQIQVTQSGMDYASPVWDSGKVNLSSGVPVGVRTSNLPYAGPTLQSNGMKYFWRIKFWDNNNNEGMWSNGRDFFFTPGQAIQNLSYRYDNVGNITQLIDNSSTSTAKLNLYGYDNLNRLISAKITDSIKGDYTQTFAYDSLGNITNKSDVGAYSYNGNQGSNYANPDAVTGIGTTTLTYDKNGNLLTSTGVTYVWDYRNQLSTSTVNRVTSTYLYDQDGNRVLYKKIGGTTTTYPNKLYSVVGTTTMKQVFLGDTLVATIKGSNASSSVYNVHGDQVSNSNGMTTASGTIAEVTDYYPFGAIRFDEQTNGFNEPRKFTGHEYDMDTNLNYFGARYQNGAQGQFISQDPTSRDNPEKFLTDPQQFNFYSYARDNPLTVIDPTGLYNIKTGVVEKGDTPDKVVGAINNAFGIKTDWKTVQNVSFYSDNYGNKTLDQIVGKSLGIGTNITADITKQLNGLNQSRSQIANLLGKGSLGLFAPNMPWDIKNSSDPVLGGGKNGRTYWSYVYNGDLIRYDAPGNINYGYVARSVGLPGSVVQGGAALEQLGDNVLHGNGVSFADNKGDSEYVQKGIDAYNSKSWWQKLFNW